jgi:alkylhydroperoxidase family enzyme
MTARTNPFAAAPQLMQQLVDYGRSLLAEGLEPSLVKLVAIRACQLNASAAGLHMHLTETRSQGESNERLDLLNAWRDTGLYSDRERAALAWTEALTRLPATGVPDEVYAPVEASFTEEEQVRLTLLICVTNSFNRVGVAYRVPPQVQPQRQAA